MGTCESKTDQKKKKIRVFENLINCQFLKTRSFHQESKFLFFVFFFFFFLNNSKSWPLWVTVPMGDSRLKVSSDCSRLSEHLLSFATVLTTPHCQPYLPHTFGSSLGICICDTWFGPNVGTQYTVAPQRLEAWNPFGLLLNNPRCGCGWRLWGWREMGK